MQSQEGDFLQTCRFTVPDAVQPSIATVHDIAPTPSVLQVMRQLPLSGRWTALAFSPNAECLAGAWKQHDEGHAKGLLRMCGLPPSVNALDMTALALHYSDRCVWDICRFGALLQQQCCERLGEV